MEQTGDVRRADILHSGVQTGDIRKTEKLHWGWSGQVILEREERCHYMETHMIS